ncbi:exported hypothetical protein [Hyella patelloides LEGE 07179]|uniref:PEP-CTERM sorting domain-containing protein n=1 Tax=Hyella patelloides LEGE 07179 TaxID=945734 RepID=A0A563W3R5_9CYAN|nr:hypothetical protein [Hyella patelloides]VEP18339.1 exported hypothetical protein [Hyella patelloides LEGE 07179]
MKIFKIKAIGFSALFFGLAQVSATGFTIDAFSDANSDNIGDFYTGDPPTVIFNPPINGQGVSNNIQNSIVFPNPDSDTQLSNVAGSSRHMKIDASNNSELAKLEAAKGVGLYPQAISVTNNPGVSSVATAVWNGNTTVDDYNDLTLGANLNADLDDGIDDSIAIEILFADQSEPEDVRLILELYDGTDIYGYSQPIPGVDIDQGIPQQTLYYDYQTYIDNSVDVNNIEYIAMTIDSNRQSGYDATFNFLQTAIQPQAVPFEFSPALGLILGGSFFSFLKLRKKFQQN